MKVARFLLLTMVLQLNWGCQPPDQESPSALGTPELRSALFDSILVWTADRAAFSPPKNAAWSFDPLEAMAALRDEVVDADSDEALFYALLRLSNARKDRHLSVALVPGGLTLEDEAGLPAWGREDPPDPKTAPIRVLPDYGDGQPAYFVADVAQGVEFSGEAPVLGDRIISVNGMSMKTIEEAGMGYIRHSSMVGFRWKLAETISLNTALFPPDFRGEMLVLELERADGSMVSATLPYLEEEGLEWTGWAEPTYPGFTLQISDVIEPFVRERQEAFQRRQLFDGDGPETVDDGTWLMDWLENDVLEALARGDEVTAPVPFKLAHAPKDSDGILQPAPVHFGGPLVVFSGPDGGSHLDQFISIVADNELGPILGIQAGGYSNTWEWEEVLTYPGTDQPVVGFMWNIGHSIRPNGEILEGNPADVTHPIPLTAENAGEYHAILLGEAFRYLASVGFEVGG